MTRKMQNLLGWFGGAGLEGTIAFFGQAWGIPAVLTVPVRNRDLA